MVQNFRTFTATFVHTSKFLRKKMTHIHQLDTSDEDRFILVFSLDRGSMIIYRLGCEKTCLWCLSTASLDARKPVYGVCQQQAWMRENLSMVFVNSKPGCEKTCLWCLSKTKTQTSLCICADQSAQQSRLMSAIVIRFWKVSYLNLQAKFQFSS